MNKLLLLAVIGVLIAGVTHAQSVTRVQRGQYDVDFTPQYSDPDNDKVDFTCTRADGDVFLLVLPDSLKKTLDTSMLPGSIEGTRYTYECRLKDKPLSPKVPMNSLASKTATVIVHDCGVEDGWEWISEQTNSDNTIGNCVKLRQDCSASDTVGNYVCFENPAQPASSCVMSSASSQACCAANSFAAYPHVEGIMTFTSGSGGVTICGVNYNCGVDDGVDPEAYGVLCRIFDPNTPGVDPLCYGKAKAGPECNIEGQLVDTTGPVIDAQGPSSTSEQGPSVSAQGPSGWLRQNFVITVAESDDSGLLECTYSSELLDSSDLSSVTTKSGVSRTCNAPINVRVGGAVFQEEPNCPLEGRDACTFIIKTRDNSLQKNEASATLKFSIDTVSPKINSFSVDSETFQRKIIGVIVSDTISGIKTVSLIADGGVASNTCSANGVTNTYSCSISARDYSLGIHSLQITVDDNAGNTFSDTRTFIVEACGAGTCNNPGPSCNGNSKVYYDTPPVCVEGLCQNGNRVTEECAYGCSNGECNANAGPTISSFNVFKILLP